MENKTIKTENHRTILFDHYNDFVVPSSENIPSWISTDVVAAPKVFKEYEYPVSSWPVIINDEIKDDLFELSTRLPELIARIPALYFEDDVKRIADFYFDGNEMLTEFSLLCHNKNVDVSCRLDLAYTDDGFKVLEANIGSTIGGWQVQSFESIIRKKHPALHDPETADNFFARNTQLIYFEFLIEKVLQYVGDVQDEINILVSLEETDDDKMVADSYELLDTLMRQTLMKKSLNGSVILSGFEDLKLSGRDLYLGEKRIHCLLNLIGEELPLEVFRAFVMDRLYLPDHLGTLITKDKRNLGILRELAEQKKFSPADNALVLRGIPYTQVVSDTKVIFRGTEYDLLTVLREQKEQFVIKVAVGLQGKDVYVGKHLSQEAWEEAIQHSLGNEAYIVQEFCDSLDFIAPNPDNQWKPHKLIWGSFGFGNTYGGVWVRMSDVGTDVGVINSATGAVEAIVYETVT